ncbi:uncharacterized protein LOC120841892 [Ixodes scapularis]|uniref:uncharacterized protein LOC120841892 n=1 Tax=Ixodes scapularis TaxID=6945 RepID=UPI001A9DDBC5|nr:uncharacterized protein LOC120841892 [Ixodes scapularis]
MADVAETRFEVELQDSAGLLSKQAGSPYIRDRKMLDGSSKPRNDETEQQRGFALNLNPNLSPIQNPNRMESASTDDASSAPKNDRESKLAGGMKARGRYRSRSLSASSTDSYSSGKSTKNARD